MKRCWRKILDKWKSSVKKQSQLVSKDAFPGLLKILCENLYGNTSHSGSGKNSQARSNNNAQSLVSGFRKCGIFPFNPDIVIEQLPNKNLSHREDDLAEEGETSMCVTDIVLDMLSKMRYNGGENEKRTKRSKASVPSGQSISCEDFTASNEEVECLVNEESNIESPIPAQKQKRKRRSKKPKKCQSSRRHGNSKNLTSIVAQSIIAPLVHSEPPQRRCSARIRKLKV